MWICQGAKFGATSRQTLSIKRPHCSKMVQKQNAWGFNRLCHYYPHVTHFDGFEMCLYHMRTYKQRSLHRVSHRNSQCMPNEVQSSKGKPSQVIMHTSVCWRYVYLCSLKLQTFLSNRALNVWLTVSSLNMNHELNNACPNKWHSSPERHCSIFHVSFNQWNNTNERLCDWHRADRDTESLTVCSLSLNEVLRCERVRRVWRRMWWIPT